MMSYYSHIYVKRTRPKKRDAFNEPTNEKKTFLIQYMNNHPFDEWVIVSERESLKRTIVRLLRERVEECTLQPLDWSVEVIR